MCFCMHIMSMIWSIAEAVHSGSCPIQFKVLTLNVAICIVRLHVSHFCFSLSLVADFSNADVRAPTSAGRAPFLPVRRAMQFGQVVWVWVMVIFWWLLLFSSIEATFIDEQQQFLERIIWSWLQNRWIYTPGTRLGIALNYQRFCQFALTSTMLLPMVLENLFLSSPSSCTKFLAY